MNERASRERAAIVFLVALMLFCSPFTGWWSALQLPWWAMFVPWALVIGIAALFGTQSKPDSTDETDT